MAAYWGKLTSHIPSRSSSSTHWRKAPHSILYIEYEIAHCSLQYQAAGTTTHHTTQALPHTGPHYTVYFTFYSILYIHTTLCMKLHISKHHTAADTTHAGQHYTANCTLYHADRHCNCTLCASVESSALALIALR